MKLGYDDLIDVLKVHAARQALLCAKEYSVSALLERFAECSALGKAGVASCDHK